MTSKLQTLLTNPFLRQNPFRPHQSFASSSITSSASYGNNQSSSYSSNYNYNCYKQKTIDNYKYLSVQDKQNNKINYSTNHNNNISTNIQKRNNTNKNKINPFYRKNLIQVNQQINDYDYNYDYVEFNINKIKIQEQINKRPQYMNMNINMNMKQSKTNSNINIKSYQDLSYKAPPTHSVKYISLQQRHNSHSKNTSTNIQKQKQNLTHHRIVTTLISPRFPTSKHLQSVYTNIVPPLLYKQSRKNIQTPTKDHGTENNKNSISRRDSRQCSPNKQMSHRQCSINQELPEKDGVVKFNDKDSERKDYVQNIENYPKCINVRGQKYYRNIVQKIYQN